MAEWKGKTVDAGMFDQEIIDAFKALKEMNDNYNKIKQDEKFIKKFKNRPIPEINPNFTDLFNAVNEQMSKRNLTL